MSPLSKQIWVCPKSILFYICGRNEFFLNFATIAELVKILILFPKKSNLEPIKSKKRAKSEFTEDNHSFLHLKSIEN